MKKILELVSISAGYDDKIILEDVNLSVYKNDFLGVIGPNGCGKTTLLKIILGLMKPLKGKIIYSYGNNNNHKIGYLPQFKTMDLNFPIKVFDVVLSGLSSSKNIFKKYTKNDIDLAKQVIDDFGISTLENKKMGELSGGQMQRVFLCRAVVSSPELLILDEPSTHIDSKVSQNLYEVLNQLNKKMAIVLVSHDMGSVLSSVKNVACVDKTVHYHNSDEFSSELFDECSCPIKIVGHGDYPHTVLKKHGHDHE